MTEEEPHHRLGAEQWDGTAPCEHAAFAAFPLKDRQWAGLRELLPLPDESRRDFDVLVSVCRGMMDDKGYYFPPERTVRQLSALAKELESVRPKVQALLVNATLFDQLMADDDSWSELIAAVDRAAAKLRRYQEVIASKRAKTGPAWGHLDRLADVAENILHRHGLTLAVVKCDRKRRQRSQDFLRKLLAAGGCEVKAATAARIVARITRRVRQAGAVKP